MVISKEGSLPSGVPRVRLDWHAIWRMLRKGYWEDLFIAWLIKHTYDRMCKPLLHCPSPKLMCINFEKNDCIRKGKPDIKSEFIVWMFEEMDEETFWYCTKFLKSFEGGCPYLQCKLDETV